MKSSVIKGIYAGFIATVALSVLMVIKSMLGMLPNMNAIKMLASMAHGFVGTPMSPLIGWILHFAIGVVLWGVLFALLYYRIPTRQSYLKGLLFGTAAWLLMMLIVMPMAGAGLFGLHIGPGAPIATLVLHWIYGAILGAVFGRLTTSNLIGTHSHA